MKHKSAEQKPAAWICDVPVDGGLWLERVTLHKPTHPNCANVKPLFTALEDSDAKLAIAREALEAVCEGQQPCDYAKWHVTEKRLASIAEEALRDIATM